MKHENFLGSEQTPKTPKHDSANKTKRLASLVGLLLCCGLLAGPHGPPGCKSFPRPPGMSLSAQLHGDRQKTEAGLVSMGNGKRIDQFVETKHQANFFALRLF